MARSGRINWTWCVACLVYSCTVALLLQGCGHKPICPWGERWNPPTVEFKIDYSRLDALAGCNNNWDPVKGNPCASDVPVLLAKKGIILPSDEKWIRRSLENEESNCLTKNQAGLCTSWFSAWRGCWRDEVSVCNCTTQGSNCESWKCFTKEIYHYTCWEANWDSAYATKCDMAGVYPMTLSYEDVSRLFASDAEIVYPPSRYGKIPTNWSISYRENVMDVISDKTQTKWKSPNQQEECFVNRPVGKLKSKQPKGCKNNHWRTVTNKIFDCACTSSMCSEWSCTASRRTLPARYYDTRKYKCLRRQGYACLSWSGEVVAFPVSAVLECRSCPNFTHCYNDTKSVCTRYGMERMEEFNEGVEGIFFERFFFFLLHNIWLLPSASIVPVVLLPLWWALRSEGKRCEFISCACCLNLSVCVFIWFLGFVRYKRDYDKPMPRKEQQYPISPLIGLMITFALGTTLALCWVEAFPNSSGDRDEVTGIGWILFLLVVMAAGCIYTLGLFISLLCIFPICCGVVSIVCEFHKQNKFSALPSINWAFGKDRQSHRYAVGAPSQVSQQSDVARDSSQKTVVRDASQRTVGSSPRGLQNQAVPRSPSAREFGQALANKAKPSNIIKRVVSRRGVFEFDEADGFASCLEPFKLTIGDTVQVDPNGMKVRQLCESEGVTWRVEKTFYVGKIGQVIQKDLIGRGIRVKFDDGGVSSCWWSFPPEALKVKLDTLSEERREQIEAVARAAEAEKARRDEILAKARNAAPETASLTASVAEEVMDDVSREIAAKTAPMPLCVHGCGRFQLETYPTCCVQCAGPDGPHASDCAFRKVSDDPLTMVGLRMP